MAVSPIREQSDLATFSIKSNGKEIEDLFRVYSIKIDSRIDTFDSAEISVLAGNSADGFSKISVSKTFSPGAKIDIELGYENKNVNVFTGLAVKQIVQVNIGTGSLLKIVCVNENKPAENIPEYDKTSAPALEVEYGNNIMEIELALNSNHQSSILTKYSGYIVFQGTALAKENSLIKVKGFGPRFNKNVFISGVEHNVIEGSWITKAQIGIPPEILGDLKKNSAKK